MTVSYNLDVSSVSAVSFVKLLFRWRGSIWKSVKSELFLWIFAYYMVLVIYRYWLTEEQQSIFARISQHCDNQLGYIPLTFMLGFFVTIIVDRWRQIFSNMGWIENIALTLATVHRGKEKEAVLQRRTIIRYLVLTQILVFRDISMRVRRRFPNMESIVTAGFIHEHELELLEKIDIAYNKYWAPVNWALKIVAEAHREKRIEAPPSMNNVIGEIRNFRTSLALLCNFDWVPIPIAYPQVVFLAVRAYFVICLVSRQYIIPAEQEIFNTIDLYVPFMTILQFIFFVGWMKVAEALLNPLGEDDDDFEANFLIDKNLATGMAIVDTTDDDYPALLPDNFMNRKFIPIYSEDSTKSGVTGLVGSVEGVELAKPHDEIKMVGVSPYASMCDLTEFDDGRRLSTSQRLKRRLTSVIGAKPHRLRSYSIQPLDLGSSLPANFACNPVSSHSSPRSSFRDSISFGPSRMHSNILSKVEEEKEENQNSSKENSVHRESTDAEDEVHPVFLQELNPEELEKKASE